MCGVLLISCNENSKINQLKDIKHGLETDLQVLQKKLANENQQKQFTIVSDSVRAGEGLFQVLNRMGIADTDRRKIVLAIQDSVELSNLRVGQVFYALKDSLESVEVFRYQENLAKIHLLYKNKKENTFDYKLASKKLTKKQSRKGEHAQWTFISSRGSCSYGRHCQWCASMQGGLSPSSTRRSF